MSFQRILAAARLQGLPLIVTDGEGKAPMVILPFDTYEALTAEKPAPARAPAPQPLTRLERLSAEVPEDISSELDGRDLAGLTLEERFYVDPGEGEQRI